MSLKIFIEFYFCSRWNVRFVKREREHTKAQVHNLIMGQLCNVHTFAPVGPQPVHARYTLQTESVITTCSHNQSCRDSTFRTHWHTQSLSASTSPVSTQYLHRWLFVYRVEGFVQSCIGASSYLDAHTNFHGA